MFSFYLIPFVFFAFYKASEEQSLNRKVFLDSDLPACIPFNSTHYSQQVGWSIQGTFRSLYLTVFPASCYTAANFCNKSSIDAYPDSCSPPSQNTYLYAVRTIYFRNPPAGGVTRSYLVLTTDEGMVMEGCAWDDETSWGVAMQWGCVRFCVLSWWQPHTTSLLQVVRLQVFAIGTDKATTDLDWRWPTPLWLPLTTLSVVPRPPHLRTNLGSNSGVLYRFCHC